MSHQDYHFAQMFAAEDDVFDGDAPADAQQQPQQQQSPAGSALKLIQSKYGAALMTLVAVFALLIITRPPMIMRDISSNPYNKEYTINWTVVFIWCASASLVVLAIEPLIDVIKRYG